MRNFATAKICCNLRMNSSLIRAFMKQFIVAVFFKFTIYQLYSSLFITNGTNHIEGRYLEDGDSPCCIGQHALDRTPLFVHCTLD